MLLPLSLPLLAADPARSGPLATAQSPPGGSTLRTIADFQAAAAKSKALLRLPRFERRPAEVEAAAKAVIAEANKRLDALAAQDPANMDAGAGRRLRREIYAVCGSREAEESIHRFLGRERSIEPFLKHVGLK